MMTRKESSTRAHILRVAATMVADKGGDSLHISEVAKNANIGVPTIYYHFDSLLQLVAEAQLANYMALAEPLHRYLTQAEEFLAIHDEKAFWGAIEENLVRAWTSGQIGNKIGILKLFIDVGSDEGTRRTFSEHVDTQFARWIAMIEGAKRLGWLSSDVDAKTLTTFFWAASVGQVISINSAQMELSPQEIRDFVRRFVRQGNQAATAVMPTTSETLPLE